MIPALIFMALAALLGWVRASKRGGNQADKLQYAAVHGIAAFLVGLIAMTVLGHLGWLDAA